MSFDFLFGVFAGMALTVFGLVAFEFYEQHQERKRSKKDNW